MLRIYTVKSRNIKGNQTFDMQALEDHCQMINNYRLNNMAIDMPSHNVM